jgi:hypothetical protein
MVGSDVWSTSRWCVWITFRISIEATEKEKAQPQQQRNANRTSLQTNVHTKMAKKPEVGICFPTDPKGGRSTQVAGKNILSAAIRGVKSSKAEEYAALCDKEKNWRFKYNKHLMNMVKLSALRYTPL